MLYEFQCENGHKIDVFEHCSEDFGCRTIVCQECGYSMGKAPAYGKGIAFFAEGHGHWITNLGPKPVYVTSHAQHKRLMKQAGVVEGGVTLAKHNVNEKGKWI